MIPPNSSLIFFDGVCNLCNKSVQLILRNDTQNKFRFAPLQSSVAKQIISSSGSTLEDKSSIVLFENGRIYRHSTAVLRIAKQLRFPFPLLYACILIPIFLRDGIYKWIANNRYRWFGRKESCMVPNPRMKAKFLSEEEM